MLYGANEFCFLDKTRQQVSLLQSFLNCIGLEKASLLAHLSINSPISECQSQKLELREDGLRSLKLLQERCTGLTTLNILISSKDLNVMLFMSPSSVQKALLAVDTQLKAIPSLAKVIVRVSTGKPDRALMVSMQNLEWVVLPMNNNQW